MRRSSHNPYMRLAGLLLVLAVLIVGSAVALRGRLQALALNVTGEEKPLQQLKAFSDLAADALRPGLSLAPNTPIRYAEVNPFGVNVFLNEEVDPAKREETVRLASEAGYHFLRQEFPWQDIEIHGKGDFVDRRNGPPKSAWDKYDNIVDLAERYHMELIVRVSTPPSWSRALTDTVGTFAPPDNYADFGDFVYTLVSRYRGRIHYYQIWNEPNIYPEWGSYAISPEKYTELLKVGATRARQADPDVAIICGALASTISLNAAAKPPANALNDLIFLQRMYDAGAAPYFDIMAMQAYGLWSGPTDRRMQPRVMNYGRPQFVRDLMVANGDAAKPIWISEMAWNAVPDEIADKRFGQVTPEQQGRYTVGAYQRAMNEWPWVGVVNTWYFKRATDDWFKEAKPEAYFRLADPDFKLQPVYHAVKDFIAGYRPELGAGTHSPGDWAVKRTGTWASSSDAAAPLAATWESHQAGDRLAFAFRGSALSVMANCAGGETCGRLRVTVDGLAPVTFVPPARANPGGDGTPIVHGLPAGTHQAVVDVIEASAGAHVGVSAFVVK